MSKLVTSAFGGQIDDAEAVLDYMKRSATQTDKAATLRSQFLTWYQASSWFDKNFSSKWYDEMRSRKNAFDIANAVTPKEKELVNRVLTTGFTAEQMQGKPRPPIDVKTGLVGSQIKNPSPSLKATMTTPGKGLSRNLKKGVTPGEDIKQWQAFLGIEPVTGYFDAVTDAKTREYQKKKGLVVDGIVGKNTWGAAFPISASPFAPPKESLPATAALTTSAIKPQKPTSAQSKPSSKPAAKPASQPAATSAAKPAETTPTSSVAQAGLTSLTSITKLPLWAKILGAVGAVGAVGGAMAFGVREHKKSLRS